MAREQQFVARDFMGLGQMDDVRESRDSGMPLKLHEVDLGHLSVAHASINNGILFNSMAFADLKHPLRSNAGPFQHLLASGNLHEEKHIEQSGESAPERSYPPLPQSVQAWWRGDSLIKRSALVADDYGLKTQLVGGFGGLLPKNATSIPTANSHTRAGFPDSVQLRMPTSEPIEKKESSPLTIFYGGNVNVFNDITAEQAQAIMFLASTGNFQGMASAGGPNASAINLAMTSASVQDASAVNLGMAPASVPNISSVHLVNRMQMDQRNCYNGEIGQAPTNQAGFGSANMQLDLGHSGVPAPPPSQDQPVVPTALPQARKASLARFLEKRRERVHSKSPYPLKQADSSLPEERFSSSNDIASYRPYNDNEEKKKFSLPSWMERLPEYSSDLVVKEDTKIVSV